MSIEDSDDNTKTIAKTLWSETLIDVLMVALEKNASDDKVKDILKELKQKQFKASEEAKALGDGSSAGSLSSVILKTASSDQGLI